MFGMGTCALVSALLSIHSPGPAGIGVLGDSYSDEYRFYPPDRSTARNWVELLAEARGLDFGPYAESGRAEPRNQGFAYNWARSDAETGDLLATGQHTGLAAQVAQGEVGTVIVFAGGNDFIHALQAPDPLAALDRAFPAAVANYRVATATILDAGPRVHLLLLTLPDIVELPEFAVPLRNGRLPAEVAAAYRAAVHRFNAEIRALAASSDRAALLDLERVERLSLRIGPDRVFLAGRVVDRTHPSNEPGHLFLADSRHMGTFGQAVLAKLIVDTLDARFGAGIEPLGFRETFDLGDRLAPNPAPGPVATPPSGAGRPALAIAGGLP